MLYQIYVISEIKLNLEMFQYKLGSQQRHTTRIYPTDISSFSKNASNSFFLLAMVLITLLINFFGRIADWNCYIDTRETDGITD